MISKIKNLVLEFLVKFKKMLGIKLIHSYKNFSIELPADHKLPVYQSRHPKYDKFLPKLVKKIEGNATIIDVGANCGDTLAGMVEENAKLKYICIEPDQAFYDELLLNIERIKKVFQNLDVAVEKYLVGKSVVNVSLVGVGGTKHAVIGAGTQTSKPLDDIIRGVICPPVRLLKTDVDGFDYDVINSAQNLLLTQHPILFFECQCDFEYQKFGFEETISWLKSIGYLDWTIFDNYGEMVLRTDDISLIFQMMDYVWRQDKKSAARTIYYYDILAGVGSDRGFIDDVLSVC